LNDLFQKLFRYSLLLAIFVIEQHLSGSWIAR
jgi:hypothetical protein